MIFYFLLLSVEYFSGTIVKTTEAALSINRYLQTICCALFYVWYEKIGVLAVSVVYNHRSYTFVLFCCRKNEKACREKNLHSAGRISLKKRGLILFTLLVA